MVRFIGLGLLIFFMNAYAHAGIMIEPYVGYEKGKLQQTGSADIDSKGAYFGARLGYEFLGIKLGADYQTATEDAEQSGTKAKYKPADMGVFIGYKFPILLHLYASYFVSSKAKLDPESFPADFTGNGMRYGVGWTGLPFVCINLEAISRTYDKYDKVALPAKLKESSMALSISLPFP